MEKNTEPEFTIFVIGIIVSMLTIYEIWHAHPGEITEIMVALSTITLSLLCVLFSEIKR